MAEPQVKAGETRPSPLQVVVAGVLGAVIFVTTLVLLVSFIAG